MTTPKRKPVFIEKIMPVTLLNEQVYYEHGGNPFKGLHRWYSRKPLSFSRASVLGSLLPADITIEEFEYLLGLNRRVSGIQDKTTKLYKTPPSPDRIKKVQALCEQMWGTKTPKILDAFAGGGSIPFEAARYGLNVLASDLNPVAVVIMKAAIEYPLKFGADLQVEIDKWVKWVGDEAEKRLTPFFPSLPGEKIQNYLWAHTVKCPNCESVVPLSPNWWLYKRPEKQNLSKWCAVKPIPNISEKRVDFELAKGKKGKGETIVLETGEEYDPASTTTLSRATGKCPNCGSIIENEAIKQQGKTTGLGQICYAVAYRKGEGSLIFRTPNQNDLLGIEKAEVYLEQNREMLSSTGILPDVELQYAHETHERQSLPDYGVTHWHKFLNFRQLVTLTTYVEIINEAKQRLYLECEKEEAEAISTYLALVLDRCVDANCRLVIYNSSRACIQKASTQHSMNLMWNYPETNGATELWRACQEEAARDYTPLCNLLSINSTSAIAEVLPGAGESVQISLASADSLFHISNNSIDVIVTDPPYYSTIQYAELSDFFYVWQKRTLGDIFPDLYCMELTDKDREAVANPSRFRDMGTSPEKLANQDYEAKMALAFAEYYRVLRDDGVMTVQFNHKDSGAWDVLAKSLIDAGFEITASWAVSTENPQNLHQAQKNSVSSTVLLVCRKRDPNAG